MLLIAELLAVLGVGPKGNFDIAAPKGRVSRAELGIQKPHVCGSTADRHNPTRPNTHHCFENVRHEFFQIEDGWSYFG